jgi:hypothetical protein
MNNYTKPGGNTSQLFFTYKQEKNAIYVAPHISANYGYIMPISNRALSGNTYTFIYQRKRGCEIFIAPISQRKQFSKAFVSYKKYNKKLQKYLDKRRTKSYTNIIEIPKQTIEIKKSHTFSDLRIYPEPELNYIEENLENKVRKSLGVVNKMMEIFNITPTTSNWPLSANDFRKPEPVDDYFFGSSPDDFVEDFIFDE